MRDVADLFAVWPAAADLGRDLGVPYPTVSAWKQRGSIPAEYWREFIDAARQRGHPEVTADVLAQLHARGASCEVPSRVSEDGTMLMEADGSVPDPTLSRSVAPRSGQFSRWKHLRRHHFASSEEILVHLQALREEWDRR